MLANLFRVALVAVALACVTVPATAAARSHVQQPADPELGVLWIAVGVGLFVFMIWVAARLGDNDR